jgi:hypothetical protein
LPIWEKIAAFVYLVMSWVTRECAVRPPALGVDGALRDPLAVLVGELFEQLVVLQQYGSVPPGGDCVLIVPDRGAGSRRQRRFFAHRRFPELLMPLAGVAEAILIPPRGTASISTNDIGLFAS